MHRSFHTRATKSKPPPTKNDNNLPDSTNKHSSHANPAKSLQIALNQTLEKSPNSTETSPTSSIAISTETEPIKLAPKRENSLQRSEETEEAYAW